MVSGRLVRLLFGQQSLLGPLVSLRKTIDEFRLGLPASGFLVPAEVGEPVHDAQGLCVILLGYRLVGHPSYRFGPART